MECVARSQNGTPLFECACPDCGKIRIQDKRKVGKPCRKCAANRRKTHGLSNTKIYRLRNSMIARCKYPSASNWKYYGGRGITVCQEWIDDAEAFAKWAFENGYSEGMEIDRKDNNGPYAPWNCRFISHQINSQLRSNKRCTLEIAREIKQLLSKGESIGSISESVGMPYMVVWHIDKGNTWRNA